jgi:indole-3-glycerol phosphate synthase
MYKKELAIAPETDVHIDASLAHIGLITLYTNVARHMHSTDIKTLRQAIHSISSDTQEVAEVIRKTAEDMGITCSVSPPQYTDYHDSGGCIGISILVEPKEFTLELLIKAANNADYGEGDE